ncbi:MAG: hypothetical protein FJZ96_08535 [Chloroflexi bacterium]|nr:hypothetical protein [Chloroflexota bacterium]
MKFPADMGISPRVVAALRKQEHNAVHLQEQGLGRLPDIKIIVKAKEERRILLTHDLDFGELLAAGGDSLPSVTIFRLKDMRAENVLWHLRNVIAQHSESLAKGAVCSVTERRVRIRPLPI